MKHPAMRAISTLCLASALSPITLTAQTPLIPPDLHGDTIPTVRYRANDGQVIDTDGQLRPDVHAYSEGSPVKIYAREESTVSFVMRSLPDTIAATPDTLFRVDMAMAAEANGVDPVAWGELPGITN
jgi:hypothetical protein